MQIHTEDPYSKNENSLIGYPDYDYETKVQAVIWDLTLDMQAGSATYNLLNGEPRKFTDSFKTLTPGHTYRIEYTLHKKGVKLRLLDWMLVDSLSAEVAF